MTTRRRFLHGAAAAAALAAGARADSALSRPADLVSGLVDRPQAPLPGAQLRALRAAVRGHVYAPGDHGYRAARQVFNRRFDGVHPPAVVRVRDAADVEAVVRWANRYDVALVARSGGHGYTGNSTSRHGVVVDVGGLDRISLSGTSATLGPGARLLRVYATLAGHGRTIPAGSCPTVAVGGLTLGGGMGLAGRAHGLTLDRIKSFDAVLADGRLRRVDAQHEPDLFWALRGGGGSFAIVTAIRLRTHAAPAAAWFRVSYPKASRAEALAAWDALAPSAPRELTAICTVDGGGASAIGQYLGSESALRRLVAPLAAVPGASLSAGTDSYLALQRRWAGCAEGSLAACLRYQPTTFDAASVYVAQPLSAAARADFVAAADAGAGLVCDAYGGALNEVAPADTAFVHRRARFSVQILSYADVSTAKARVRRGRALVAPHGNGEAYQNYPYLDQPGPLRAYYGANLERLRRVKAAVDAGGRFSAL